MNNEELLAFFMNPEVYPDKPARVDLVQTHISWVFIGDQIVYKVKKPVDFGFLDFSTLEKRAYYVAEELRLNARFSPEVYLAVVPVSLVGGSLRLGDKSNIVEYALKMRRISEENMLYKRLDLVTPADMARVGAHVARLYAGIPSDERARAFGGLDTVATNVIENFDQTRKYIGGPLSQATFERIETWSRAFMDQQAALFERRLQEGCIKDCHGDLHLQHICMEEDKIFIFDCIEFNERFRFGDVAADVAFLAMDCDFNGRPELGEAFVTAYTRAAGDTTLPEILTFYKVYRAYVRAKVTSFLLDDEGLEPRVRQEAFARAKRYYDLAEGYCSE